MSIREISYPQIQVLPHLTVPAKRVTYTFRIWRITLSAVYQQPPVIPDAFKDDSAANKPAAPLYLKIKG